VIDHVVLGVGDLDAGAAELEARTGFASVAGGRHTGRGTANRIVPLGSGYLELLAVVDEQEAERSSWGAWARRAGRGLTAWCVSVPDLDGVCSRLGLTAADWSRVRPDGVELRWRLAGVEEALADPLLPFFIEWDVPADLHPQAAPAAHRVPPQGILRLDLSGDDASLRDWLGGATLPVTVTPGPSAIRSLAVATRDGGLVVIT
jgi:hypothetical protein